jgi:hypothetical protein
MAAFIPLFGKHAVDSECAGDECRWSIPNLRVLRVEEIKTVPYAPMSHPFIKRLIGTIRREYLDQTLFWTAADLEEKLRAFQQYFNRVMSKNWNHADSR